MTDESHPTPPWYCLECAKENTGGARYCRQCGRELLISPQQHRSGVAFILNELEDLRTDGTIGASVYDRLRRRYREAAALHAERSAPAAPSASEVPAAPAPRRRVRAGWRSSRRACCSSWARSSLSSPR